VTWGFAFFLTVACEAPLAATAAPAAGRARAACDSALFNLTTHPLAWLAVTRGLLPWAAVELTVFTFEALAYAYVTRLGLQRGAAVSALANGCTAALSWAL